MVSANTGTAALTLAVDALRPTPWNRPGKPRVLVPSLTFVASFQAVLAAGCEPVACDVLPDTGTLDLADAERRLTASRASLPERDMRRGRMQRRPI